VTFTHNGVSVSATVIDRGPFRKGYKWDLTKATAKAIGFLEVGSGPLQATVTPVVTSYRK
jgi:rare lipoprotein A (peptidoglycan hydrolase)